MKKPKIIFIFNHPFKINSFMRFDCGMNPSKTTKKSDKPKYTGCYPDRSERRVFFLSFQADSSHIKKAIRPTTPAMI